VQVGIGVLIRIYGPAAPQRRIVQVYAFRGDATEQRRADAAVAQEQGLLEVLRRLFVSQLKCGVFVALLGLDAGRCLRMSRCCQDGAVGGKEYGGE
jgi:hypothetical protein